MKNAGFTLIELLVVVLIIGILSAVALPQYQNAVKKSRFMRLAPLVKSMVQAEETYYMANGIYTKQSTDLDISWPDGTFGQPGDSGWLILADGTRVDLLGTAGWSVPQNAYVSAKVKDGPLYAHYLEQSPYPGKRLCVGEDSFCKILGGEKFNKPCGELNSFGSIWTIP